MSSADGINTKNIDVTIAPDYSDTALDGLCKRLTKIESLLQRVLRLVGDHGSFYETHDKVHYKRSLLQQARDAQKSGGLISIAEVKTLIDTAFADGKVSPLELRSLSYIHKSFHLTMPAAKILSEFLVSFDKK